MDTKIIRLKNNKAPNEGLCSIGRTKSKSERVETDKSN